MNKDSVGAVLVLGSGIGGIQASLDLAEQGFKVYLVDEKPAIGGVMAQLDKTFPTNDCAMCLLSPKLVDAARHPNIEIITHADLLSLEGRAGDFTAVVRKKPRFITEEKCTGCGQCVAICPVRNVAYFGADLPPDVELRKEDLEKITAILDRYRGQRGSLLPVLQDVNQEYHYLPEEILRYVSLHMGIPLSQIYHLATFYNAFSLAPKGRHVIQVCTGTACYVKGARRLLEGFERVLGIGVERTTGDLKFSLETVSCLGCCGQAPVVTVSEDLHGHMTQARIPKVLEMYG